MLVRTVEMVMRWRKAVIVVVPVVMEVVCVCVGGGGGRDDDGDDDGRCVPGTRSAFDCPLVEVVLEFVEYHLAMGVDHIHFGVDYDFDSGDMWHFLAVRSGHRDGGMLLIVMIMNIIKEVVCLSCQNDDRFDGGDDREVLTAFMALLIISTMVSRASSY
jgi:hypothetical protein